MTDTFSPDSLTRREMIEATAAAVVTPLLATRAVAALTSDDVAARYLTRAELAMLDELTEMIIPTDDRSPGAREAKVAAYIDSRLAESLEPAWQKLWRAGLAGVDALSREMNGKAFMTETPD